MLHVQIRHDSTSSPSQLAKAIDMSDERFRAPGIGPTSIDDIYRFINRIYRRAKFSPECIIIALVYINRALVLSGMPLTESNIRPCTLVAMILAQKIRDDRCLRLSSFAQITPEYPKVRRKRTSN